MVSLISIFTSKIETTLFHLMSQDTSHFSKALSFFGKPGKSVVVAYCLGILLMIGLYIIVHVPLLRGEGILYVFLSIFHMWEFIYMSKFHEKDCTVDSFLVNHSIAFCLATLLAQIEYFIELLIFGKWLKCNTFLLILGTLLCFTGQFIRTGAMYQAGSSFHHIIQEEQSGDHQLVTTGFYSFSRHPSYFGWFIWAISTQIILGNPIMFFLYTIVTWKFFNDRIQYEEVTLLEQYGEQYMKYQSRVPTRIPGIQGVILEKSQKID